MFLAASAAFAQEPLQSGPPPVEVTTPRVAPVGIRSSATVVFTGSPAVDAPRYLVRDSSGKTVADGVLGRGESAIDLTQIDILFSGGNNNNVRSGFLLDNLIVEGHVIPEPSTFLIWSLGLLGLAAYARRRRTK